MQNRFLLCHENGDSKFWKCVNKFCVKLGVNSYKTLKENIANYSMLHHNNAPCHTALSEKKFLTKKSIPLMPRSPAVLLPWFESVWLSSMAKRKCRIELKECPKGRYWETVENIEKTISNNLKAIHSTCSSTVIKSRNDVCSDSLLKELFWKR